jgi:hypothetical protein
LFEREAVAAGTQHGAIGDTQRVRVGEVDEAAPAWQWLAESGKGDCFRVRAASSMARCRRALWSSGAPGRTP